MRVKQAVGTGAPPSAPEERDQAGGARVLYVSYDGLMEPLGQSQVFQYLRELARSNDVTLVTYEKPADWADAGRRREVREAAERAGIRWHPLKYHNTPSALATAFDIQVGLAVCARLVRRHRIQIVHARSYVPGIMALAMKRLFGTRFVFDMRGFWPDERLDAGQWSTESRIYRTAKGFERRFFRAADVVVSLTHVGAETIRGLDYLRGREPRVEVIPTCTNMEVFRPYGSPAARRAAGEPFTLGYVGSVGPRYRFDEVLQTFGAVLARRPDARLLVINRGQHAYVAERVAACGVPAGRVEVREAPFAEVARQIGRMDAAVFFYNPAFSTRGTAPTRMGEFLACGVPCLANRGVGDVETVLAGERVGVALDGFGAAEIEAGADALLRLAGDPATPARCVEVASRYFSLDRGVQAYADIWRSLAPARA